MPESAHRLARVSDALPSVPHPAPDDASLIARLRQDDESAFEHIYRAEYPRLAAVAAHLATPAQADDLAHDVLYGLWARRQVLDPDTRIRPYLLAAVRFAAAGTVRRFQVADRLAGRVEDAWYAAVPSADASVLARERADHVARAVQQLPERCRQVFLLIRREGLSYADTADALGISIKTVEAQMGKALRRLRQDLQSLLP